MRFSELADFDYNDINISDIMPTTDVSANIDKKLTMQNLYAWIVNKATATLGGTTRTIKAAINALQDAINAFPLGSTLSGVGHYTNASGYPYIRFRETGGKGHQLVVSGAGGISYQTQANTDADWVEVSKSVPNSRKVNGHPLSSDVTVTPSDLGVTVPYKKGNSVSVGGGILFGGYITNGTKQFMFTIPMARGMDSSVTGCTVTATGKTVRGINGYVDSGTAISDYTIEGSVFNDLGLVVVTFVRNSGTLDNGVNNTPVTVLCACTVKFT